MTVVQIWPSGGFSFNWVLEQSEGLYSCTVSSVV